MTKNIVLLGDKTLSLLARNLNSELHLTGSELKVIDAGYDSWLVALLDSRGVLFEGSTTVWGFVLSPRVLEAVPDIAAPLDATLERLDGLKGSRTVLFSNFFADPVGAMPVPSNLERNEIACKLNQRLLAFREDHPWFHIVDHVSLALQHGVGALHDPRFEATAQLYFSPSGNRLLSAVWLRSLRCLERARKKVCVIDLDNTLWGGILGEDGPDGLRMGDSGDGYAHRRFQLALLELRRGGVLLAACSKNNPDETLAVLQSHPDCLLRPAHFAHIELGWGLKSEAIVRIAEKLRLGLDSFLFIDDSPREREEVALALPAVDILEFPSDPLQLVRVLGQYPGFDALRHTEEDRKRADSYQQESERSASKASAVSPEEFYRSLGLRLRIFSAHAERSERLHQLLMKTNQFNMTGKRLSAEEFRVLLSNPGYVVLGLRVSDRFGDSGITGLAIIDIQHSDSWTVQNFLLSCRVIGRTVENAFIAWLLELAGKHGARNVVLQYVATGRNQVAHGFLLASRASPSANGDCWNFDVGDSHLPTHFVQVDDVEVTLDASTDAKAGR